MTFERRTMIQPLIGSLDSTFLVTDPDRYEEATKLLKQGRSVYRRRWQGIIASLITVGGLLGAGTVMQNDTGFWLALAGAIGFFSAMVLIAVTVSAPRDWFSLAGRDGLTLHAPCPPVEIPTSIDADPQWWTIAEHMLAIRELEREQEQEGRLAEWAGNTDWTEAAEGKLKHHQRSIANLLAEMGLTPEPAQLIEQEA